MQPISNYADSNDKLRLVLQGPSGTGKTTLACQFPGAYIIDIDVNLGGSLRFIQKKGFQLPIGYDNLDHDEQGKPVPLRDRFLRLEKLLREAQSNPQIETIVFDSGTTLADVLIAEICRQQSKNSISDWKDGRQFWGLFAPMCRNFFTVLSMLRKHIVLIAHERTQKSESGAVIYPIKVAWPGQVGENIGVFFTNVWRTEVQQLPDAGRTKYIWSLRTMPDAKYELKNTLGLPPTFEFKWEIIAKALNGGK